MTNGYEKINTMVSRLLSGLLLTRGLTKREYFAAMAMQGLLSSDVKDTEKKFATQSVRMADALINALNQTK